jgi:8-oxo-dGTP pyrophosphatase MutT (NUDIX family)
MSVVGATFLIRDDKILLLRRGNAAPWCPGQWDLPGGQVEEIEGYDHSMGAVLPHLENTREAATRELYEEAGVWAEPYDLEDVTIVKVEGEDVHFYKLTEWVGEPEFDTTEHQDMKWVTMKEAFRMDVVPGIKRALFLLGFPGVRALGT